MLITSLNLLSRHVSQKEEEQKQEEIKNWIVSLYQIKLKS